MYCVQACASLSVCDLYCVCVCVRVYCACACLCVWWWWCVCGGGYYTRHCQPFSLHSRAHVPPPPPRTTTTTTHTHHAHEHEAQSTKVDKSQTRNLLLMLCMLVMCNFKLRQPACVYTKPATKRPSHLSILGKVACYLYCMTMTMTHEAGNRHGPGACPTYSGCAFSLFSTMMYGNYPALFTSFSVNRKDSWDKLHVLQVECRNDSDGQTQT